MANPLKGGDAKARAYLDPLKVDRAAGIPKGQRVVSRLRSLFKSHRAQRLIP